MDHLLFISQLKKMAPTKEDYLELGVSYEFAVRNEMNYIVKKKSIRRSDHLDFLNFELINLISDFDCSTLQIGLVSFSKEPQIEPLYCLIGHVELDILAINKVTFEVEVLDHDMPDHLLWSCASNGEAFLDALFEFASYLIFKVKNKVYVDNAGELECVKRCVEKAGGEKYSDFYQMLIQS